MKCKGNSVHTVKEIMPQLSSKSYSYSLRTAIICTKTVQKVLDRSSIWYIIIFTYRDQHSGDSVNAQGGQEVQARRPQAARHSQSASGRSNGPPVRNWRFLRSRRPSATQVRDASPCHCRQAVGYSVRYSIRLLAPYLLSSGSRLSARWPFRAIAREARTPKRPQTHAGGSGLRHTTPGERFFVALTGLGRGHPGTVCYKCTSTEYRTRTQAAGKKTSLNTVGGARKPAERET